MAETTLLTLALAAQDAHARLAAHTDSFPEPGRFLIGEVEKRLAQMVAAVRERDQHVDVLHDALADRMNNLLMAIKTASDLLRNGEDHTALVRERLDATVENGRESVKKLRDALGNLR
ncbi:MAG TPA: histidine kinase [Thermoanaerobaculia bacterium]|nr:histidine kinase [Thermoanaerobaculia bacterium]